jgi:hypothetical protein
MIRHTNSPIWCVALLLVACGDDASTEVRPTPLEAVEASVTTDDKGASTPHHDEAAASLSKVQAPEVAVPSIEGLPTEMLSARAPERVSGEGDDKGELDVISGFDHPSAVLYDAQSDRYLVSNLRSGEDGAGPGYIARVDPDGTIEAPRWIDGASRRARLKTPRGLAIIRGRLYVADGAVVRVYDRVSGVRRGVIKLPGASQLSGIARGVSDSLLVCDASYRADGRPAGTDAVYRINRAGRVSALFRSAVLGHPAGVSYIGKTVWIATTGSGKLHGLKANGTLIAGPKLDEGGLTGLIEIERGDVIITSQVAQGLYRGSLDGSFTYIKGDIGAPGHPGWDPTRRRVLVPSKDSGLVHVVVLPAKEPRVRRRRPPG